MSNPSDTEPGRLNRRKHSQEKKSCGTFISQDTGERDTCGALGPNIAIG